jgi:hypothetical protein
LRFTQRGTGRAIKRDFAAYGTCGEGITHKASIPNENVCVNGSHRQCGRRSCRRSPIPLPPKVGSFLGGFR